MVPAIRTATATRAVGAATSNVVTKLLYGGVADTRPVPRTLVDRAEHSELFRMGPADLDCDRDPVLLVPALAAPATCFDLRRGCSLAEHLVGRRYRTYLLDYGNIEFADRALGIERWVGEILPAAIQRASADSGGRPVHLVSWCLGGLFSLLTAADQPRLPIASIAAVASPIDFSEIGVASAVRGLDHLGGNHLITGAYRALGVAPSPLVKLAYQGVAIDKYLSKPISLLSRLHDRHYLAQVESVDRFMNSMIPYPGRALGQIYHAFVRDNALSTGTVRLPGRTVSFDDITAPVLAVAGDADGIAPQRAVARGRELLTGSPDVRFEVCPGGHLGVLTGRRARHTTWRHIRQFHAVHPASLAR